MRRELSIVGPTLALLHPLMYCQIIIISLRVVNPAPNRSAQSNVSKAVTSSAIVSSGLLAYKTAIFLPLSPTDI
jgi:hypothetical protein